MSVARRIAARTVVAAFAASSTVLLAGPVDAQSDPFHGGPPANVFISPSGKPFRARPAEPYPVVAWFKEADANGDGKIDHAEFIADSLKFFKLLDRNGDGVISPQETAFYENRIAPEVLGMRVEVSSLGVMMSVPRVIKAQGIPGGQGPGGEGTFRPGGATGPGGSVDPGAGTDTGPDERDRSRPYDASGAGASPYSFFDEPEPIAAADFHFRGLISKADFTQLAEAHFEILDKDGKGALTLDSLPRTPAERRLRKRR